MSIQSTIFSKFRYLFFFGIFTFVFTILFTITQSSNRRYSESQLDILQYTGSGELRIKPIILSWNDFFSHNALLWVNECDENIRNSCYFTKNRNVTEKADAIIFHSRNMEDIPDKKLRNQNQSYVFWTQESPINAGTFVFPEGFFNWTMTFSPFSDVMDTYGKIRFIPREANTPQFPLLTEEVFRNKTRGIVGMISNCNYHTITKRLDIVKEINRFYPVNLAGNCGWERQWRNLCPKKAKCEEKVKKAIEDHFFHFVLENTDCLGYVSEKTFNRFTYLSIPIASRRQCYKSSGFPEDMFIFLDDYENADHLAHYLRYLEQNPTAYNRYFKWREEYETVSTKNEEGLCGVCKKLIDEKTKKKPAESKVIKDVYNSYTTCFNTPVWNLTSS